MRLIVDVPAEILKKIRNLITEGRYSGFEDFIIAALHNQVNLEEIEEYGELSALLQKRLGLLESRPSQPPISPITENLTIIHPSGYHDVTTTDMPSPDILHDGPLWGQYNRIFPVKLALRALANSLKGKGPYIPLDQFQETAASLARRVGFELRDVDKAKSRSRGEKLSTGLPVGENAFKSKARFKNQFIGYIDRTGYLVGSPAKLRFVSLVNDAEAKIGVTKSGLDFAKLRNPVIDEDRTSDSALSDEEIQFYIHHVFTHVSGEAKGMLLVLRSIEKGYNRPDKITEVVSNLNESWTKAQAATFRSGLISRMYELGLISRKRLGVREVAYELAPRGKRLLQEHTGVDNH